MPSNSYDLTQLVGFNFGGLEIDTVDVASTKTSASATTYTVSAVDFEGNNTDNGIDENNVFDTVTAASNGTEIDGSPLTNPDALGQIVYNDTVNGAASPSNTYDVLGYSADGSSILVGLAAAYNPATPNDPYGGAYALISDTNIDGNATPSLFPTTSAALTFSTSSTYTGGPLASGGVAADLVTVTNALAGLTIPANKIVATTATGVTENADGSFSVASTATTLAVGKGTLSVLSSAATGLEGQPTLKFAAAGGTVYFQVVGWNATQILLQVVSSKGVPTTSYDILSITNAPPATAAVNLTFSDYGVAPVFGEAYPCFLRGTRLATPSGEVPVEKLVVGDLVCTELSGPSPIKWIGRSPFNTRRHLHPDHVWPVRIRAGALGEALPRVDLLVSPGHSLRFGGVLIQAERLINGATIFQDRSIVSGTYYHIELDRHDIVLSEGVPSESYLDTGNRTAFIDGGDYVDLHPDFSPRHWSETCLPLVQEGEELSAVRARLLDRAHALGWRLSEELPFELFADGKPAELQLRDGRFFVYRLPAGARTLRLHSCASVPKEIMADAQDVRRLGVSVLAITQIDAHGTRTPIALDDAALTGGWYDVENDDTRAWRWTNGDATLLVDGAAALEVTVDMSLPWWEAPVAASELFAKAG